MRLFAAALVLMTSGCATTGEPAAALHEASVKPGINDSFLGEDFSIEDGLARFEVESREVFVARDAVVAALGLERGMEIADVGAGTGLFVGPFAEAVGSQGRVFAVDLVPKFVDHLRERAREAGLDQVVTVQCTERSAELEARSVDVIFTCDTYHHFEYPRSTLASLYTALRPGGQLVIVDFERIPGVTQEWIMNHVRAGKDVVTAEVLAAGFRFDAELEVVGLSDNYCIRFVRP